MNNNLRISFVLFILVAVGSWSARHFGFYNTYWFADIILHTISGIALGYTWVGLQKKEIRTPWFIISLGAMSFATLGSVLWEFWEFAGWRLTPTQVPFYIPQLGDTLGDILCGLLGGLLGALIILAVRHSRK